MSSAVLSRTGSTKLVAESQKSVASLRERFEPAMTCVQRMFFNRDEQKEISLEGHKEGNP